MKSTIVISSLILLTACKSQTQKDAQQYHDAVTSVVDSYKKPTSKDGLFLSASVNGKEWIASKMLLDNDDSHPVVQAYNEDNEVMLFYLNTRMSKGKAQDMQSNGQYNDKEDALTMLTSTDGERTITNMNDKWIEGTFHFTAADEQKTKKVEITNGFFRIPKPKDFHLRDEQQTN
jgi:hypothetical protein